MLPARDISKTPQISLAAAARDILMNFEISLAVFIPNRNRAISYTNCLQNIGDVTNVFALSMFWLRFLVPRQLAYETKKS